ncbi:tetratricopeptide repeat protein [Pannonibacter tanglangensis]|uniref:Tetratricopeptide repeat protein n=1 Tax=Pannonibacter tanglangensis TaxID=2750084 RepID=A0ABW9ZIH0_9HYPH|nr:tetratricopeptide repeat protein [Pannonibacter sp. XCT-34]NBN64655.1 tetratricopeptide repeat protein [Pannonibacter sp. XCT-34]
MSNRAANHRGRSHRILTLAAVAVAVTLAGGCAKSPRGTTGTHAAPDVNYVAPGSSQARAEVERWGSAYQSNPSDRDAAVGYANALRRNGQLEQATAVLRQFIIKNGNDREVSSAYGKLLAMNGNFPEALNVLQDAQNPAQPDWRLMSAEAAVHDQMGNHDRARQLYAQALKIAPDEPTILNNMGLSYLLSAQLPEAEYTLRRAAQSPRADSRLRQNLSLALALQGKFAEAEQVAMTELDPEQASANIAYVKAMLAASRQQGQQSQTSTAQPPRRG